MTEPGPTEEPGAVPEPGDTAPSVRLATGLIRSFKWLRVGAEVRWLFLLALVTRLLAAAIAPAIRNDSFDLLSAAEFVRTDGLEAVLETSHHPATVTLIALLSSWLPAEGAGTALAILGGSLAVWPLHGIARHVAGRHAATAACVFYAALPQAIEVTSVPMDEGLFLPLFLASVAFYLAATSCSSGAARRLRFGAAGLAAGLAYLCRPEGLLLGAALVAAALLRSRPGPRRLLRACGQAALVLAGILVVAAPYIAALSSARGRFEVTPKKSLAKFLGGGSGGAVAPVEAPDPAGLVGSVVEAIEALSSAMSLPLVLLAVGGLIHRTRWRHRRPRAARVLVLLLALPLLAAVARLNAGWGYGGGRHALGAALLLLPFAGEGLYGLGVIFSRSTSRRRFTVFLAVLLAMPLATRGLFLSRGRGSGRAAHLGREIVLRQLETTGFDDELVIASFHEPLVAYYADRENRLDGGSARHVRLLRDFGPLLRLTRDLPEKRRELAARLRQEEADFLIVDLYARDRGADRPVYPERELAALLQVEGVIARDAIAAGAEIAAFRVLRAD